VRKWLERSVCSLTHKSDSINQFIAPAILKHCVSVRAQLVAFVLNHLLIVLRVLGILVIKVVVIASIFTAPSGR
jgi:hypothetical protein